MTLAKPSSPCRDLGGPEDPGSFTKDMVHMDSRAWFTEDRSIRTSAGKDTAYFAN